MQNKKTIQIPLTIFFAKLLVFIGCRIKKNIQKYKFILT